jgi:hypothetical protein
MLGFGHSVPFLQGVALDLDDECVASSIGERVFDFESACLARRCSSSREFDVSVCVGLTSLNFFFSFLFADTSRFIA